MSNSDTILDSGVQRQLDRVNSLWQRLIDDGISNYEQTRGILDQLVAESRIFVDVLKNAESKLSRPAKKDSTTMLSYCKKQFWLL